MNLTITEVTIVRRANHPDEIFFEIKEGRDWFFANCPQFYGWEDGDDGRVGSAVSLTLRAPRGTAEKAIKALGWGGAVETIEATK